MLREYMKRYWKFFNLNWKGFYKNISMFDHVVRFSEIFFFRWREAENYLVPCKEPQKTSNLVCQPTWPKKETFYLAFVNKTVFFHSPPPSNIILCIMTFVFLLQLFMSLICSGGLLFVFMLCFFCYFVMFLVQL